MISRIALSISLALCISSIASAGWTATIVNGSSTNPSFAFAVTASTVYGSLQSSTSTDPTSWTDGIALNWNQGRSITGQLFGSDGFDVVGGLSVNAGAQEPVLFRGSPENFIRLSSSKVTYGRARATWGGIQVGFGRSQGVDQAAVWRGTAKSFKSIHPRGYVSSEATTILNLQIGGSAYTSSGAVACAWEGSNYRFKVVDSSPSEINASNATSYGGFRGHLGGTEVAYLWSKGSNAATNVAPPNTDRSWVTGMDQDKVSITSTSANYPSQAWVFDTFNSITPWTDLHMVLDSTFPGTFYASSAMAVWRDTTNNRIRVVGRGYSSTAGNVAILWEYTP